MISSDKKRVCLRAVDHFGVEHQKRKAIEELADVVIMCEQLRLIYGGKETDAWIDRKLERLWKMMRLPERSMP